MKVLFIVNGYPNKMLPEFCIFTKEQIESVLSLPNITGDIIKINVPENGRLDYIRALAKIKRIYRDYDIIHCFHGYTLLLSFMIIRNKPILVSFLSDNVSNEFHINNRLLRKLLAKCTYKVLSKKNIYKVIKSRPVQSYEKRSFYLPNGVDTNLFSSLSKIEAKMFLNLDINKKYILFVNSRNTKSGGIRKEKRYDIFLKVIEILKTKYKLDDIDQLLLMGIERKKVPYYFAASELHLLVSDFEGSPNSIKEALACNIPVVSTDVGNVRSMFGDIEGCYISETNEPEKIAQIVTEALNQNKKYNSRKYIFEKKLSINQKAMELYTIYCQIMDDYYLIKAKYEESYNAD